jgi:hypothetical protein
MTRSVATRRFGVKLFLERLELGSHLEPQVGLGLDNKDLVEVGYGSLLGPKTHVALRTP